MKAKDREKTKEAENITNYVIWLSKLSAADRKEEIKKMLKAEERRLKGVAL